MGGPQVECRGSGIEDKNSQFFLKYMNIWLAFIDLILIKYDKQIKRSRIQWHRHDIEMTTL